MSTKIYHNPRCSKSRQTLELLNDKGVETEVIEYLNTPPDAETLEKILNGLGMEPRELMRKGQDEYKALGLDDKSLVIAVENGVYSPARIKVAAGNAIEIKFLRKDPSPCAETLLIPDLDVSEMLPLDKEKVIHLPALEPGEYAFHCQMQMYRGQITVD